MCGLAQSVSATFPVTAIEGVEDSMLLSRSCLLQCARGQGLCQFLASHRLGPSLNNSPLSMSSHFSVHPRDEKGASPNRSRAMDNRVENDKELSSLWT